MKRNLALELGQELKYVDYEYEDTVSTTVAGSEADPVNGAISVIGQGDSGTARSGISVTIVDVIVHGFVRLPALTASADVRQGATVKILLVLDTQTNGLQLDAEKVLAEPSNADLAVLSFRNLEYEERFLILDQAVIDANPQAEVVKGSNIESPEMFWHFDLEFHDMKIPVTFTGVDAAVSNIADNSLHVIAVGSDGASTVEIGYLSRVRYYD